MDRWGRLAWVAVRQQGVVTVAQAAELGITRDALSRRAREQRWLRLHPGVYALPGQPESSERTLMAGLLFLGSGAAVGMRSAAHLWQLVDQAPSLPEYLIPHERRRGQSAQLRVFRSRTLGAREITKLGPLAVTRIDRTLCDLAAVLDEVELREAVARSAQRSMEWPRRAAARAAELPALKGRAGLLDAIRDVLEEGRTDSVLERRVRRVLRAHGFRPAPGVYPLTARGRFVAMLDIAFPGQRVAVEVDGFAHHSTPTQLRADHGRHNRIQAEGWTILRIGEQELTAGAGELLARLAELVTVR